ncbi:uncharacterized protein G2W53_028874 [Senna tora]|uniref:Uncharacterized protein n=1 Tax=Senna tora TaxID=362788 RepID=A0A834T4U6_9FABA|nr:uncharacterized protein G2W53_028874 [Senna tora]
MEDLSIPMEPLQHHHEREPFQELAQKNAAGETISHQEQMLSPYLRILMTICLRFMDVTFLEGSIEDPMLIILVEHKTLQHILTTVVGNGLLRQGLLKDSNAI